jgi:hypothetical protein
MMMKRRRRRRQRTRTRTSKIKGTGRYVSDIRLIVSVYSLPQTKGDEGTFVLKPASGV